MRFEWDEDKNCANVRKHGIHFLAAAEMFIGPLLVRPDTREEYREERWIGVGTAQSRVLSVAFTERPEGTIRIISLRKADYEERNEYEEAIQNGLGAY